jgi:hypothetical protein
LVDALAADAAEQHPDLVRADQPHPVTFHTATIVTCLLAVQLERAGAG